MSRSPLEYQTPATTRDDRERRLAAQHRQLDVRPWLIGAVVAISLVFILVEAFSTRKTPAQLTRCAANLRLIGAAIEAYANEHLGRMPPDLATLAASGYIHADVLVCPASADARSAATQPAALAADLIKGGCCSYTYLGVGRRREWSGRDVILYERVAHHANGVQVLLGDGDVELLKEAITPRFLTVAAAATRPVEMPSRFR